MKKRIFCALMALLLLMSLTACSYPEAPVPTASTETSPLPETTSGALREDAVILLPAAPESLDPMDTAAHGYTTLLHSTLLRYDESGSLVGDLAASCQPEENGKLWRITLREGLAFSDGTPLTASDVEFTLTTAKNRKIAPEFGFIMRADAQNDQELTVRLFQSCSLFPHALTSLGILPKHAYGEGYSQSPVGTGPYLLESRTEEELILAANPHYHGEAPALKRVTVRFGDQASAVALLKQGAVDAVFAAPAMGTARFAGYETAAISSRESIGITMPLHSYGEGRDSSGNATGNSVTCHREIRQAAAYAIDRAALCETALNGFGTPAFAETEGMPWSSPETKLEADADFAAKLLSDAGWADTDGDGIVEKDGVAARFRCLYPQGDSLRQSLALAAAEQLLEVGIAMEPVCASWERIRKNMYTDALLLGWGGQSPCETFRLYRKDSILAGDLRNPQCYHSADTERLITAALAAQTEADANALWQQVQWNGTDGTAMAGQCPWVWLVHPRQVVFLREGLTMGSSPLTGHGHGLALLENISQWHWE